MARSCPFLPTSPVRPGLARYREVQISMLPRLAYRLATEISPRLAAKAAYLWVYKGRRAMAAFRRRLHRGELFPPSSSWP